MWHYQGSVNINTSEPRRRRRNMPHDAGFLARCEQFLLHPTVRALSLAQRVDFLEKKGLSPEEITTCLKNVERQNGLSRLLHGGSGALREAGASAASGGMGSLWSVVKRVGVPAATTLLIAYGYVQFRQKMVLQLMAAQREAAAKRHQRRYLTVVDTLRMVAEQRKQYDEVVARVKSRVTRLQLMKQTQHETSLDPATLAVHKQREKELCVLQEQVATLKAAVVDAYKASVEKRAHEEAGKLHAQPPRAMMDHPDMATPEELMDEKPPVRLPSLAVA